MQDYNPDLNPKPTNILSGNINLFFYVLIVLGLIFVLYQGLGSVIVLLAAKLMNTEDPDVNLQRIALAFGQFMFILIPTIFFTRFRDENFRQTFRLKRPRPILVFLSVLGIILIQPSLQGYLSLQDYLIQNLPFLKNALQPVQDIFDEFEKSSLKIVKAYSFSEFLVVILVISVTPAICEEVLFRGFVLRNFTKIFKAPAAIFLSGLLFALYHFQPFNLIPLIALGAYLGFVVYYSGSIWLGVICHFINNFTASYYLYISGRDSFKDEIININSPAVISATVLSMILFFSILWSFYRMRDEGL